MYVFGNNYSYIYVITAASWYHADLDVVSSTVRIRLQVIINTWYMVAMYPSTQLDVDASPLIINDAAGT